MPELSRFFGIIIAMYWSDHNPPHFHARYGEHRAAVDLNGRILEGGLPRRALSMVREWLALHRSELERAWESAQQDKPLRRIRPLE